MSEHGSTPSPYGGHTWADYLVGRMGTVPAQVLWANCRDCLRRECFYAIDTADVLGAFQRAGWVTAAAYSELPPLQPGNAWATCPDCDQDEKGVAGPEPCAFCGETDCGDGLRKKRETP